MSKKLVFFGSGPVAAATLESLRSDFEFDAVITKPHTFNEMAKIIDKQTSRIYKVDNSEQIDELAENKLFQNDIGLVVDFGIFLSKKVLDYFKLGVVNSHFSLLPQWRGADPITFAVLSGQATTGVSLMLTAEELDEGPLLAQKELAIKSGETTPQLTQRLTELSNSMLKEYLPEYDAGELKSYPQPDKTVSWSRRLTKKDGVVNWTKPAEVLEREIRAYAGWPRSRANVHEHEIIITKARVAKNKSDGELVMPTGEGYLEIQELIAPSGRSMAGADFLRGYAK